MRPANSAIQAIMGSGWNTRSQNALADGFTFTLISGEVFRFTSWQTNLTTLPPGAASGPTYTFSATNARFTRTKTKYAVGAEVDELEIDIDATQSDGLGNLTWQKAALLGLFDGATCDIWRIFMSPPGITIGSIDWFSGRVADIDIGRTRLKMKVKSLLDLLTIQMPRRLWQSSCGYHFGDARCGYNRVAGLNGHGTPTGIGAQTFVCELGTTQALIVLDPAFVPSPPGIYNNGTITGTTGENAGFSRSLLQVATGAVCYLLQPFLFTIVPGVDTFTVLPGCDKSLPTCNTFDNQDFYGGFPYIPPPETAI